MPHSLYPLETSENLWFLGVMEEDQLYEMGGLSRGSEYLATVFM